MPDERQCGDCTLCCKLMGIEELKKPANKWCELVQIGKGCGDYENRPKSCRDFQCMWLQGQLPEDLKPNKIHAVFWEHDGDKTIQVHLDPHYTGLRETEWFKTVVHAVLANGFRVAVLEGDRRTLLASDPEQVPEEFRERIRKVAL